MTKHLFNILLCSLVFMLLAACGDKKVILVSDLERLNIKGKVSNIKSIKDTGEYDVILFNEDGNRISHVYFNSDASISREDAFEYDAEGRLSVQTEMVSNKKIIGVIQYSYDIKGRLLNEKYKSEKFDYVNYSYNDDNKKIERLNIAGDAGNLNSTTKYIYNTKGDIEKVEWVKPNGSVFQVTKFKYNDQGMKIKKSLYLANDKLAFSDEYNDTGNRIKSTQWDADNNSEISISKGKTDFSYEYDDKSNWIKRESVIYENGRMIGSTTIQPSETKSMTARVIEYRP